MELLLIQFLVSFNIFNEAFPDLPGILVPTPLGKACVHLPTGVTFNKFHHVPFGLSEVEKMAD